jgi:glycosyltransferase involved in cell wall biosynthesis
MAEPSPRVVIAHDNLWWYGGAERIAATIAAAFPGAPFWTILGRREVAERMGIADRTRMVLPESRAVLAAYRALTPLYPAILRARRLPEADVLLTSSFAFANHFRTKNRAPQLCYCYSPLRFAWSMTAEYGTELPGGRASSLALRALAGAMRPLDRHAARGVTRYVAESEYVAAQIRRFYDRDSAVIYPPVDCDLFRPGDDGHDGYYLFSGRLIEPYKQPGIVIDAFRDLPHRLLVAGDGPARAELERRASTNVEVLGRLGDADLVGVMQRCAAVIFPSVDDFGLIPVEVMACGRPVLAFRAGGALETVVEGATGRFFDEQTDGAVAAAVESFDPDAYDTAGIREHALRWRRERFVDELRAAVADVAGSAADYR